MLDEKAVSKCRGTTAFQCVKGSKTEKSAPVYGCCSACRTLWGKLWDEKRNISSGRGSEQIMPVAWRNNKTLSDISSQKPKPYQYVQHPFFKQIPLQCFLCGSFWKGRLSQNNYGTILNWARNSQIRYAPSPSTFPLLHSFFLKFQSKRYKGSQLRLFPGSGPSFLVPEEYYKSGKSETTAMYCLPYYRPTWGNLVEDINGIQDSYPNATATVCMTRADELGTNFYHIREMLSAFKYSDRVFITVRSVGAGRSATSSVKDLLHPDLSLSNNSHSSAIYLGCWSQLLVTEKKTGTSSRSNISDPDLQVFSSYKSESESKEGNERLDEDEDPLPSSFEELRRSFRIQPVPQILSGNGNIQLIRDEQQKCLKYPEDEANVRYDASKGNSDVPSNIGMRHIIVYKIRYFVQLVLDLFQINIVIV